MVEVVLVQGGRLLLKRLQRESLTSGGLYLAGEDLMGWEGLSPEEPLHALLAAVAGRPKGMWIPAGSVTAVVWNEIASRRSPLGFGR